MELLRGLVMHVLPNTNDTKLAEILSQRLKSFNLHEDVLATEECSDLVHEKDRAVFDKTRGDMAAIEVERESFLSDWVALKRS
eukprot:5660360-Heterocapsa_arctica.AAC.1